jgi:hypothetical protein
MHLAAGSPFAIEEPSFDYLPNPFIACSFRNSFMNAAVRMSIPGLALYGILSVLYFPMIKSAQHVR